MDQHSTELSRRKVLAGVGAVGAASAGAGLGTSAFLSDAERFEDNQLVAGELDLSVGWQSNYSDWSDDEDTTSASTFFENTKTGSNVPGNSGIVLAGAGCNALPTDGQPPRTVVQLTDVKPGDFGFLAFKLGLCGPDNNPGYLWSNSRMTSTSGSGPNDENDKPEPETDDKDEADPFGIEAVDGELGRTLRIRPFYGNSSNAFESLFTSAGSGETFAMDFFDTFGLNPSDGAPTLLDFTDALAQGRGLPLRGSPSQGQSDLDAAGPNDELLLVNTLDNGADIFSLDAEQRSALAANSPMLYGLAWGLPVDHANETQTDSVAFDLGFYTEQDRHNSGLGTSIGSVSLADGDSISGGTGQTALTGVSSGTGYGITVSDVSFSGTTGPTITPTNTLLTHQYLVGLHVPPSIMGNGPTASDSLIGFQALSLGSHQGVSVAVEDNTFSATTVDQSLLQGQQITVTATLWHGLPQITSNGYGIGPSGPVRDVDGSFIQDDVTVEFP